MVFARPLGTDENGNAYTHHNTVLILVSILVGVLVGVPAARKIQMTSMPQLVALFNGVGGGAAALVAIVEYLNLGEKASTAEVVATAGTGAETEVVGRFRRAEISSPGMANGPITVEYSVLGTVGTGVPAVGWSLSLAHMEARIGF